LDSKGLILPAPTLISTGGALVHLYTDGTVLVSHGGTEMGQGLHTKVCQVAAQAFGVPVDHVYVNDSSSDKVANSIATAASMSADMYGMVSVFRFDFGQADTETVSNIIPVFWMTRRRP
jgi:xanthine dehydrogenase molybdopterin-binding subunit B